MNSNNSSLINEFDLQRLRELGQRKSKLKRKIDNKLQILSLLPSDGYEKVIVNVNKTLVEELISENENYKFEIEHLSDKINSLKKENRDKKPKNKELSKSKKEEKKKAFTDAPIPTNLSKNLFNCFNYNEYNEDGSRKIILKRDLYNQNFYMMYRTVMQSAAFPSWNEFNSFIYKWKLQDLDNILVTTITGPEDSSSNDLTYGNYASCAAISLYPHCPGRPYREGDPICDRFQVALFINRILVCLTDGCNWGDKPRKASRIANKTIINYMKENIDKVKNIQSAIFTLLAAISDAQITIIDGSEEWTPGTTTVSCGLLLEIDQDFVENNFLLDSEVEQEQQLKEQIILAPTKWVFVSANLGDCKILHISILDRLKVNDITGISRSNSTDLTDPGGRLGSHIDGWPDLRNLAVNFTAVNEGDIIAVMSDGVHDNLDPQTLGYSPRNFDIDYDDWEKAPENKVAQVKKLYLAKAIEQLLQDEEFISPKVVKDKLINHCLNVTTKSRNFLSDNPTLKVPGNYAQYPGKLDHSSIVCFRVGRTNRLSKKGSSGPHFEKRRNVIIRPTNSSKLDIFASIKEELKMGQERRQTISGEPKILPFRNIVLGRLGSSPSGWTAARKPSSEKDYDFGATL